MQSAVLLLERHRGAGRGLGWPVAVAPDPQRLHANAELGRDSTDRLRSWATFECLAVVDHAHGTVTQLRTELLGHTPILDRKSTRLNSSHVSISYAVFCLKNNMGRYIT